MIPFAKASRLAARLATLLAALFIAPACTNADEIFIPDIAATNFATALEVDIPNSVATGTGLFYRDILVGGGAEVPETGSTRVTVQYTGWLRNGVEFDSGSFSYFTATGAVQPGFEEGVLLMKVGGVRQLIIPPELAYGANGTTGIPGQSILVFRVTLLSIG